MTAQLSLVMPERAFDGATYEAGRDYDRLSGLLQRVHDTLKPGAWWGLRDLAVKCGGSEASVSARIRDLRKPRYGAHTIEREHVGNGIWRYRLAS